MIPRTIHYFWFGKNKKPALVERCIESFIKYAPDCEIKEWNEDNFDISAHPYTKAAYAEKKWAFVSDYARLKVLYDEGGLYLDTDMLLMKDILPLFEHTACIGKEDTVHISAGIIGAVAHHPFIGDVLEKYDTLTERVTIPKVLTDVYTDAAGKKVYDIEVYKPSYFYPYTADTIHEFDGVHVPSETYAVHMWNYSWGSPLIRFTKKVRIHRILISITEKLRIKKLLKKLLKTE